MKGHVATPPKQCYHHRQFIIIILVGKFLLVISLCLFPSFFPLCLPLSFPLSLFLSCFSINICRNEALLLMLKTAGGKGFRCISVWRFGAFYLFHVDMSSWTVRDIGTQVLIMTSTFRHIQVSRRHVVNESWVSKLLLWSFRTKSQLEESGKAIQLTICR